MQCIFFAGRKKARKMKGGGEMDRVGGVRKEEDCRRCIDRSEFEWRKALSHVCVDLVQYPLDNLVGMSLERALNFI